MAQIPNLLTLSLSRTPHPSNSNSSSRTLRPSRRPNSTTSQDAIIQQTDDDAAGSRLSAVERGYLEDEFAREFWEGEREVRRMPIINRGTYVRTTSIDKLVIEFINSHLDTSLPTILSTSTARHTRPATPPTSTTSSPCQFEQHNAKLQIISLGAGTDTRFFRLLQHHPFLANHLIYHEIDFPATTKKKIQVLRRRGGTARKVLEEAISMHHREGQSSNGEESRGDGLWLESEDGSTLTSAIYNIHALDLRDLLPGNQRPDRPLATSSATSTTTTTRTSSTSLPDHPAAHSAVPTPPNIDPNIPTLILSECCLTYLPTPTSTGILNHFAHTLIANPTPLELILYEPLHPTDAFGKMMSDNLRARGIKMPGLSELEDIAAHGKRLSSVLLGQKSELGEGAENDAATNVNVSFQGWTVKQIWDEWVSVEEKERLRRCEMVDEEEEWMLLAGHYGVLRGWRAEPR